MYQKDIQVAEPKAEINKNRTVYISLPFKKKSKVKNCLSLANWRFANRDSY
jgi:hypothetical protein